MLKMWTTKFATTKGILPITITYQAVHNGWQCVWCTLDDGTSHFFRVRKVDLHTTLEAAQQRARMVLENKQASLRRQLERTTKLLEAGEECALVK